METIGINPLMLLIQLIPVALFIGLPINALIDLAKKKMRGTPLALWVFIICAIPVLWEIAYWIVKTTPESKI